MTLRAAARVVTAVLLLGASAGQLTAQVAPPGTVLPPPSGAEPTIYLLTFGPGSLVENVWGHNAIWVRDPARGLDKTYNWGMYSFGQPGFIGRLAKGTMLYWMEGFDADRTFPAYIQDNRSIYAQELSLTPAQKSQLIDLLLTNDTDANRFYRYDYWRDNCSTRARDALDTVLGGRIKASLDTEQTGVTWRWQARRILRTLPLPYIGMEFALGNPADAQISEWNDAFLPLSLMRQLRDITVLDESGRETPLVAREMTLFESTRPPEPTEPPSWLPWFLLTGLVIGGALAGAAALGARSLDGNSMPSKRAQGAASRSAPATKRRRTPLPLALAGGFATLWSVVIGLAGLGLLLAWLLTDHWSWFRNENLLQASPLSLALAALFVLGHFRVAGSLRWLRWGALAVLGLSLLGFLIQVLPGFDQMNGEIIAFALPVHAAVAWVAIQLAREGSPTALS